MVHGARTANHRLTAGWGWEPKAIQFVPPTKARIMSRYAPGIRREWFEGKTRARAMAIIAGLESLGWVDMEIADAMGYKGLSGYYKLKNSNGGTTRKKFRKLLELELQHLAPQGDDMAVEKPTDITWNPPSPSHLIEPPTSPTFEQALNNFNTALVLLVEASSILIQVTPPNLTHWATSLAQAVKDILHCFGTPDSQ